MTIEHSWSRDFRRAYKLTSNPLDRRALQFCEALVIWLDPVDRKPDAELIAKFAKAEPASLATIARQISAKFLLEWPAHLAMPGPTEIVELVKTDDEGAVEAKQHAPLADQHLDPFNLDDGPRRF